MVDRLVAWLAEQVRGMTVAERGNRRGVRETDQPGFVDHPDRLVDSLEYRREGLAGQRRRLAGTIGRSSSLTNPQAGNSLNPGSDSTTTGLAEPGMKRRQLRHHFSMYPERAGLPAFDQVLTP